MNVTTSLAALVGTAALFGTSGLTRTQVSPSTGRLEMAAISTRSDARHRRRRADSDCGAGGCDGNLGQGRGRRPRCVEGVHTDGTLSNSWMGLVTGLTLGRNVIEADGGPFVGRTSLVVTNYPITGPVISGPVAAAVHLPDRYVRPAGWQQARRTAGRELLRTDRRASTSTSRRARRQTRAIRSSRCRARPAFPPTCRRPRPPPAPPSTSSSASKPAR